MFHLVSCVIQFSLFTATFPLVCTHILIFSSYLPSNYWPFLFTSFQSDPSKEFSIFYLQFCSLSPLVFIIKLSYSNVCSNCFCQGRHYLHIVKFGGQISVFLLFHPSQLIRSLPLKIFFFTWLLRCTLSHVFWGNIVADSFSVSFILPPIFQFYTLESHSFSSWTSFLLSVCFLIFSVTVSFNLFYYSEIHMLTLPIFVSPVPTLNWATGSNTKLSPQYLCLDV